MKIRKKCILLQKIVVVTRELGIPKSDHRITDNKQKGFSSFYRIKSYYNPRSPPYRRKHLRNSRRKGRNQLRPGPLSFVDSPALICSRNSTAFRYGNKLFCHVTRDNNSKSGNGRDGSMHVTKRLQRDVVYLGCQIAPSYMSPNAGGGELRGLSQ